jgi:hypothetical protein
MSVKNNAYLKDYMDGRLELFEIKVRHNYLFVCCALSTYLLVDVIFPPFRNSVGTGERKVGR